MQGPDLSLLRRRHEEFSVEIRKEQRYQQAAKKRLLSQETAPAPAESIPSISASTSDTWLTEDVRRMCPAVGNCTNNRETLQVIYAKLMSANAAEVRLILISIRHSTCRKARPLEELITLGYIPILLHLSSSEDASISSEATWILSNIASDKSKYTTALVDSGAPELCIALATRSTDMDTQEHAIWALGNIAGDSIAYRDMLLAKGLHVELVRLLGALQYPLYAKIYRVASWTLSNLIRGKPVPPIPIIAMVLDAVMQIFPIKDKALKLNLYYILETTAAAGSEGPDQIISRGFLPKLVRKVRSKNKSLAMAVLRTIGSIAWGPEIHTEMLLNAGILGKLLEVISSNETQIRKNCMWILSNMVAGSRMQIDKVMDSTIALLAVKAVGDNNEQVRAEASYFCYNIVRIGNSTHHRKLITLGIFGNLKAALHSSSPEAALNLLVVIEALLAIGKSDADELEDGLNPNLVMLQEYECIEAIERLRGHANEQIARKAGEILDKYVDQAVEEVEMREAPVEFRFS